MENYSNFKFSRESDSRKARRMLKKDVKDTYVKTIELAKGIAEVSAIFATDKPNLDDFGYIKKIAKAYRDYNENEFRHSGKQYTAARSISNLISDQAKLYKSSNPQAIKKRQLFMSIPEIKRSYHKNKIESKQILSITPGPGIGDKLKKIKEDFISKNFKGKQYSFLKKYENTRFRSLSIERDNKESEVSSKFNAVHSKLINCEQKIKDFEKKINSIEWFKKINITRTPEPVRKRSRLYTLCSDLSSKNTKKLIDKQRSNS